MFNCKAVIFVCLLNNLYNNDIIMLSYSIPKRNNCRCYGDCDIAFVVTKLC